MFKLFLAILTSLLLLTLGSYKLASSYNQTAQVKDEIATPIELGKLTNKQKQQRKLFKKHTTGRRLPELVKTGTGDIVIVSKTIPPFKRGAPGCPPYPSAELVGVAHSADFVVIGKVKGKIYSQLTEPEDFVFSEYEVGVEEVLKGDGLRLETGSLISIVRPGGIVVLNGRTVRAIAGGFLPFERGGRYVFFLKYVPDAGGFQAFGNGTYNLLDDSVVSLDHGSSMKRSGADFILEVRAAVAATPCVSEPLY